MAADFIYPKLHLYHYLLRIYDPRVKMTPIQSLYSPNNPVAVGLKVYLKSRFVERSNPIEIGSHLGRLRLLVVALLLLLLLFLLQLGSISELRSPLSERFNRLNNIFNLNESQQILLMYKTILKIRYEMCIM